MCVNASDSANKVHTAASQLKDKWEMSVNNLDKLNKDMDDFVKTSGTNSAEIRQVANEVGILCYSYSLENKIMYKLK